MVVGVVGLGMWGTALAQHLSLRGHEVVGWTRDEQIAKRINESRHHPTAFPDVALDFTATTTLSEVTTRPVVLWAVPAAALGSVVREATVTPGALLVSAIKGLDATTLETPLQLLRDYCGGEDRKVVISGPSFARDVIARRPCGIVAAAAREEDAREAAELFRSDELRMYVSTDPLGVELGGIVKNVLAIAVGVSDALGFGDSARAGLITRGLAEMTRLAVAMGAEERTMFGLSGLGDLAMTATSDQSRNRTVGLRLGAGETLVQIVSSLGSVAEGVATAPIVVSLATKFGVEMPICERVNRLLAGEESPHPLARSLLSRPIKREF